MLAKAMNDPAAIAWADRLPPDVGVVLSIRGPGGDVFVIEDLRVTAGNDVAFAAGLLRIGDSPSPVCRSTLGLVKHDGQWLIAHEHPSAPHRLKDKESHP